MEPPVPNRNSPIHMQRLIVSAVQNPAFTFDQEYGGAFVNCWIKDRTEEEAFTVAKEWLATSGWIVKSLEKQRSVSKFDYQCGEDGGEQYQQALVDGEVYVFHAWPRQSE